MSIFSNIYDLFKYEEEPPYEWNHTDIIEKTYNNYPDISTIYPCSGVITMTHENFTEGFDINE